MNENSSVTAAVPRPLEVVQTARESRVWVYAAAAIYAVLVSLTILRHEPWADEAQAWLLGRDASLSALWTHLLHYEGSPGLWQTLLHVLVRLNFPYGAYNFVSGLAGFIGAWLFLRYAPVPLAIRLLVPFSYFVCYQYAVIARSYALVAPLLFGVAVIYRQAVKKPGLLTILLCLIAGISVHGVILAGCIWVTVAGRAFLMRDHLPAAQRRRWLLATLVFGLVIILFMLSAWPAKDVAFAPGRGMANVTFSRFVYVAKYLLSEAFTGEWITSLIVVALSLPFLFEGGGALVFVPVTAALWVFGVVVYSKEWHYGIALLVWLFAIWISASRKKLTRPVLVALAAVLVVQCYWTVAAVAYDWRNAYSGSAAAARYIRDSRVSGIYAAGYSCTALQPYFQENLYSNFNKGAPIAYWDWSKRNTANPEVDVTSIFSARHRDVVLVGYRFDSEKAFWSRQLSLLGYERTRHFEGNLFWQHHTLEHEAFDLYRRSGDATTVTAESSLDLGDADSDAQILLGVYGVEQRAWRWTAKRFSMVLRTPSGSRTLGATLALKLYLSDSLIKKTGPMTLAVDVEGYPLAGQTFTAPGQYIFSAEVPAEALKLDLVAVNFAFDKAVTGLNGDGRELASVVSSIALETK